MKLFSKLRNKFLVTLASLVLLILSSFGLFNISHDIKSVDASKINFDNETNVTITNGSFNSFSSSSSYPYTLNNFTNTGNKTPSMKTGAINLNKDTYAKNYEKYGMGEYDNPGPEGEDNYALMINSNQTSDYAYISKEFTLSANGHYYITISAMTLGDNSLASVFLMKDGKIFNDCLIQNITSSEWTNYTFFVTTNTYESVTLQFGMQIGTPSTGASGCVLFDELHAAQISYSTLQNCLQIYDASSYKAVELRSPNAYKTYKFNNLVYEYTRNNKGEIVYDEHNKPTYTQTNQNYFETSASGGGEKSVDINNGVVNIITENTYVIYKGEEEVLQPNSTYRFSMYVKANEVKSGSAFVKLEEIVDEKEDFDDFMDSTIADITAKSSNLTITSATSNKLTNGYQEYVIYVNTGALATSKVQFSFGVGTESSNATANVSFKDFAIECVPYSAYSGATSGSQVGKFNIAERISLNSSEYSNYTFDMMQSNNFGGVQYPATPTDWTVASEGEGHQLSGVVNLSDFSKMMDKYSSTINVMGTPSSLTSSLNNNVLMIYNGADSAQSYTSKSKSLTANKYYKITAFVYTQLWDEDASGVTVLAKSGDNIIAKVDGIKTEGWQRVVLYINTPSNSVNISLELALGYGNNTSSGYAFFDNILLEESDTAGAFSSRFDSFVIAKNGETNVDLNNQMLSQTSSLEYNAPVLYTGENLGETTAKAGIVDLTNASLKVVKDMGKFFKLEGDNRKALGIVLNEEGQYKYTSIIDYKFESGKYYKFTFDLFTDGIGQEEKEQMYDGSKLAQGANIEFTGLKNAKFSYITSDNEWTTYEYYIGVNSSTTSNFVFALGSDFTGCYGRAFIGNINLSEVEETEFKNAAASQTRLKVDTVEVKEEEKETEEKVSNGSGFSWVYIPTIATFLAIVVAVIGIFVRKKIKFKKRVGNKKAVYDRDITIMQHKYRRIASDRRDKEVRELSKECEELIALRNTHEEEYKDALSRLRSTRLANRDGSKHNEIIAIEREVKHISKQVARLGVQVNNYENEIEFMQTEAYLIDLEKRMMREENNERSQLRKEAQMTEEQRLAVIAKREEKQAYKQQKAELKAEKLAKKQAKLEKEREMVQAQLAQAKAMDEKFLQEKELKRIKLEEEKVAKEKAKAERELKKIEEEKAQQEAEKKQLEEEIETNSEQAEEVVAETVTEQTETTEEVETTETEKTVLEEQVETAEETKQETDEEKPEQASSEGETSETQLTDNE
ncbi:MAG: hypothetical protein IJA72_01275 [Clostridia bacterium]|nr:hypothetical protein [Clostridia bacterium]